MTELLDSEKFASAIATAFVSDIDHAPALKEAVADGHVSAERLRQIVSRDIRSSSPLFPRLGEVVRSQAALQSGMGADPAPTDWVSSLANILSTVTLTTVNYLGGKKILAAEKERAEAVVQATAAARAAADRQAQLDAARERLAQSSSGNVLTSTVAGVPVWTIPVGLAAIIGGYLIFRRK